MKSFGVALSTLIRMQIHTFSSFSQEHSMIFPEYEAGSESSASQELHKSRETFDKIDPNGKPKKKMLVEMKWSSSK